MSTDALELLRELSAELKAPTCAWVGHGEACPVEASYRAGYPCCEMWSLLCAVHAAYVYQWLIQSGERRVEHDACGTRDALEALLHVHRL